MSDPVRMVSVPVDLPLKLIDTLKPLAVVAEKLKHCHVVEVCEPTPDNTSRNIIPMPREWFERTADDLEAIAVLMHGAGVLSEGQASALTGLDRVEIRKQVDALTAAPVREEGGAVDAEAVRVALDQARRGADKAGCDGWRAQEMCRQIAQLLEKALATREEAPDWTARTEAAWAENNREEAPADHVSDARQMVEAPAEAGESLCRLSALLSASHLAGDAAVAGLGAVCWNDLRAVLDVALRAQAQAREGECQ